MTPQAWPITIGRIRLKTRQGPIKDRDTKKAMRKYAALHAVAAPYREGRGKANG